jgi:1-phosphatidylinositol phosphodiesterase
VVLKPIGVSNIRTLINVVVDILHPNLQPPKPSSDVLSSPLYHYINHLRWPKMPLYSPSFLSTKRAVIVSSMLAVSATIFYLFAVLGEGKMSPNTMSHVSRSNSSSQLAHFALDEVLNAASPIFGTDNESSERATSTWMKAYPDDTLLVHMNIPGTHDAATWNYSKATQEALNPITALNGITEVDPNNFRCQDKSLINMLSDGIRAFDLRYAHDVTNTTLVFWHGVGLQSQTATLDSLLFAFYNWLNTHPSEAIFLSFQFEGNSIPNSDNDISVQTLLHNALTSPAAKHYILQTNSLSTLASARGKITLLRRFDLDLLPASRTSDIPGLHFSPNDWTVNGRNITITYSTAPDSIAHIQDYYSPQTAAGAPAEENILAKLNATTAFFEYAASDAAPDELFWSFASSTKTGDTPPSTPRIQALGNGTELTPSGGVNDRLKSYLQRDEMKGKRLGIVMFDFYEQPEGLLQTFLGLSPPSK